MSAHVDGGVSIDRLLSVDARSLDDAELRKHLMAFAPARARLAAAEAAAIAAFDARGLAIVDGAVNTSSWPAHHTGERRDVAGSRVRFAKRLAWMPAVAAALAAGTIGEAHARVIDRGLTPRTIDAFARDEAMLVDVARSLEADDLQVAVTAWLADNDGDGPDPGSERPSEVRLSDMLDGRGRLDGELTLEDKVEVRAELDAIYDELWHDDRRADDTDPEKRRTPAQRKAAALVEMARRSSAAGDRNDDPDDGTDRRAARTFATEATAALGGDRRRRPRPRRDGQCPPRRRHPATEVDRRAVGVRRGLGSSGDATAIDTRRRVAHRLHAIDGAAASVGRARPRLHRPRVPAQSPLVRRPPRRALARGPDSTREFGCCCANATTNTSTTS